MCLHVRTGWLNVVGQFACTSGSGYLTAKHMAVMWQMGNGHVLTPFEMFLSYASERLFLLAHMHAFNLSGIVRLVNIGRVMQAVHCFCCLIETWVATSFSCQFFLCLGSVVFF